MNDHVLALLYLLLGSVMAVLFHVETLTGQGLFARILAVVSAVFFYVSAANVVFYR